MIDDVHEAVRCGNVRLNDCRVHTSAFDRYRFVVVITVHDVEVEEFLLDICWNLHNLNEAKEKKKRLHFRYGLLKFCEQ